MPWGTAMGGGGHAAAPTSLSTQPVAPRPVGAVIDIALDEVGISDVELLRITDELRQGEHVRDVTPFRLAYSPLLAASWGVTLAIALDGLPTDPALAVQAALRSALTIPATLARLGQTGSVVDVRVNDDVTRDPYLRTWRNLVLRGRVVDDRWQPATDPEARFDDVDPVELLRWVFGCAGVYARFDYNDSERGVGPYLVGLDVNLVDVPRSALPVVEAALAPSYA